MAHPQPNILIASPPKRAPALRPSSFAPVVNNPFPSMEGAVEVDPGFFEGTVDDGSGPGPHFYHNVDSQGCLQDQGATSIHTNSNCEDTDR
jgi:hypothetical protein